ncbi:hypothetical protein [uncultured Algibacter sp.]|uniref:hypothetical protein n=1 Tax=uncultured Algibacter sp. TaxID=298659 RepID=UPI003217E662
MKKIIYTLSISIAIFNCSSNSTDDLVENNNPDDTTPTEEPAAALTYDNDIKSIIDNACIRCHGSTLTNGAPFPLINFSQVSSRANRIIARINDASSPMPPNGLINSGLRAQVQQWQDDGLLEN